MIVETAKGRPQDDVVVLNKTLGRVSPRTQRIVQQWWGLRVDREALRALDRQLEARP